jgi:hypothetical protein
MPHLIIRYATYVCSARPSICLSHNGPAIKIVSKGPIVVSLISRSNGTHSIQKYCFLDVHESVHRDTIIKVTNKMQLYRLIYYFK